MKQYVLFVLSACVIPAFSQAPVEEARALLEKVGLAYRTPASLELKGTRVNEQHDEWNDHVNRAPFTLVAAADNKSRLESQVKGGANLVVFDGTKTWSYLFTGNQYLVHEGKSNSPFVFEGQVDLKAPESNLKEARILRQEVLETGDGKRACDVVEARYEKAGVPSQVEIGATTFWIDSESHFVWKMSVPMVIDLGKLGKTPTTETVIYSSIRANVNIPPDTFVFTPPEGATEMKTGAPNQQAQAIVGRPAPDFTLHSLDGSDVHLAALKGKVVLLDFWATWCVPCQVEMPKLDRLAKEFQDKGVVILGVDVLEDAATVRGFVQKNGYKYPILLTSQADRIISDYAAYSYPSTVLIDKNGVVADYKVGSDSASEQDLASSFTRISGPLYSPPKPSAAAPPMAAANVSSFTAPVVDLPDPVTASDFVHRAYRNLSSKQYAAAIQDANRALALEPELLGALRCRAQALYNANDYQAAVEAYSHLIEKYPDWGQLYDLRGVAHSHAGEYDLAIPDYTKAISLDPYAPAPYTNRGSSLLEMGDIKRALDDLNHAVELSPEFVRAYENRAKAFDKQNDRKRELADLEVILQIAPSNDWAKNQRDRLLGTSATHPAGSPALISPPDRAVFDIYPRHTKVEWEATTGAASYVVQWDFSYGGVWQSDRHAGAFAERSSTQTTLTFDFVGAQPGRWRVCPVDSAGQRGNCSEWRTFRYLR